MIMSYHQRGQIQIPTAMMTKQYVYTEYPNALRVYEYALRHVGNYPT